MTQDEPRLDALKNKMQEMALKISEPVIYDLKPKKVKDPLLHRIPFLSHLMKDAGEVGNQTLQVSNAIASFRDKAYVESAATGIHAAAIIFSGVDFLLIPAVYLSAYILNEKVPFTLNNNVRWLYATVLLALTLTAIFIPVIAPIIALVTAGLTLGLTVFLLGGAIAERYSLGQERRKIARQISREEDEMYSIQQEALLLIKHVHTLTSLEGCATVARKIYLLEEKFKIKKNDLTLLQEQQLEVNNKIKKVDLKHIMDKGVGAVFATASIIGLVLSFFFPPVGLAILLVVSSVALVYLVGRITAPLFIAAYKGLMNKSTQTPDRELAGDEQANQLNEQLKKEPGNSGIEFEASPSCSEESNSFTKIMSRLEVDLGTLLPTKDEKTEPDAVREQECIFQYVVTTNTEDTDDEGDSERVSPSH